MPPGQGIDRATMQQTRYSITAGVTVRIMGLQALIPKAPAFGIMPVVECFLILRSSIKPTVWSVLFVKREQQLLVKMPTSKPGPRS